MPFLVAGGITLDTVQFNTDPATYQPLTWERRYSVHQAIGGALTIQDFGVFAKDNRLILHSGPQRPLEESVVAALHTRYRNRGATFNFTDWVNNQFTVFIERFLPVPLMKGRDNTIKTPPTFLSLYTYQMELHVLAIVQLFGVPYTGL